MQLETKEEEGILKIKIFPSLSISKVNEFKEELIKYFNAEKISFDLSELSEIDSAGLQLLYTFIRDRKNNGMHSDFSAISDSVKNLIETYRLEF